MMNKGFPFGLAEELHGFRKTKFISVCLPGEFGCFRCIQGLEFNFGDIFRSVQLLDQAS